MDPHSTKATKAAPARKKEKWIKDHSIWYNRFPVHPITRSANKKSARDNVRLWRWGSAHHSPITYPTTVKIRLITPKAVQFSLTTQVNAISKPT